MDVEGRLEQSGPANRLGVLVSIGGARVPAAVPVLSPGRHRSSRKGACFMEFASYLAGERWSDHPACTHPLLAALARHVNDCTSNAGRQRLVELVPSVIGLTSDDPHVDARIALRAAATALPVVAADRVMAVAVVVCQQVLADLDGRPEGWLDEQSRRALARAPYAADWARRYHRDNTTSLRTFRRHTAPSIVRDAVVGIGQACVPEPDRLLHDLLAEAIDDCRHWAPADRTMRATLQPTSRTGCRADAAAAASSVPGQAAVLVPRS